MSLGCLVWVFLVIATTYMGCVFAVNSTISSSTSTTISPSTTSLSSASSSTLSCNCSALPDSVCILDPYDEIPICQCTLPLPASNSFCETAPINISNVCPTMGIRSDYSGDTFFYLQDYGVAGIINGRPYYTKVIANVTIQLMFDQLHQEWILRGGNLVYLRVNSTALLPELITEVWNRYDNSTGWFPYNSLFTLCRNCSGDGFACPPTMFCDAAKECSCPNDLTLVEGRSCAKIESLVCGRVRLQSRLIDPSITTVLDWDVHLEIDSLLYGWPLYASSDGLYLGWAYSVKEWRLSNSPNVPNYYLKGRSVEYLVENVPSDVWMGVVSLSGVTRLVQSITTVKCDNCYSSTCPESFQCITATNGTTECICAKNFSFSEEENECIPKIAACSKISMYDPQKGALLGIELYWNHTFFDFYPVYQTLDGSKALYFSVLWGEWFLTHEVGSPAILYDRAKVDVFGPDLIPQNVSRYLYLCSDCPKCIGGRCLRNGTAFSCVCDEGYIFNGTHCNVKPFSDFCVNVYVETPNGLLNGVYLKQSAVLYGYPFYKSSSSSSLAAYIYLYMDAQSDLSWGISNALGSVSPDYWTGTFERKLEAISSDWYRLYTVQPVKISCICPSVSSLNISYLNASAITLHWSPLADLSLPYSGVLVSVKDSQGVFLASRSLSVAQSSEVVGSLQPYSVFTAVVGFSMNNCSLTYTAGVSGRTPEAAPSDAPGGISVTAEARQVTVRWEAPARPNGVVSGYKVEWSEGAGSGPSTRRGVPMSAEVSGSPYVAGNLSVYTQYSFRVAGRTGAGWGPFSSPVNVSTLATVPGAAPGAVGVEALSSSSVNISWTRLDGKDANGIMLWYSIVYGAVGAGGAEVKVVATESWHVIERLLSSEAYVFKVAGVNHVGYGAYSSEALINMTLYFTTTTTTTTTVTTTTTTTTTSTTSTTTITIAAAASSSSASSGIVIGAVIGCVVVILVVLFFVARRAMQRPRVATIEDDTYLFINPSFQHFSNEFQEMKLSIEPEFVKVEEKVGEGQFGLVHRGRLTSVYPARTVAIKYLKLTAEAFEQEAFLQEAVRMKDLDHENVVKLLGVQHRVQPIFLVIEFLAKGDLRKYLLAGKSRINMATRVHMCVQVMSGLHYLQRMKYVHRDIAARNILISEENVLKIGDFGMARDIYQHQYYRVSSKGALPLRWMAPESVLTGQFTLASDIWMFGVTVWEIFSSGELPWPGVDNGDIIESLRQGKHMAIQSSWPQEVQAILLMTWVSDEETRTKSEDLLMHLKAYLKALLSRNDTEPIFYYSNLRSSKVKGIGDELKEEEEEDDAPTAPPPARHPSSSFPFGSPTNDASALDEETHL